MTYRISHGRNVHVTGRRIVATLADGIILGILSSILYLAIGVDQTGGFGLTRLSANTTVTAVLALVYYTVMEGSTGRTVGKIVTGIKVIDEATGEPPGYTKAFLRTIMRVIDGFISYLLGFIVTISSPRRRRLGDMLAQTLVVRS